MSASVSPEDATDKTVTWSSSDPAIATVGDSGKLTAIKKGSAVITAKAGDKKAECKVTVSQKTIPVESIKINKTELSLVEGETFTLSATITPEDATDKTVTWSSSDPAIATVGDFGKVTAIKKGSAVITAKAGDKKAECTISVLATDPGYGGFNNEKKW